MTRRVAGLLFSLLFSAAAFGQGIAPSEVLVIGNRQNEASVRLAKFYARARDIPDRNILLLHLPDREDITRRQYDQDLAHPLRTFLRQLKLEGKIKVFALVYGMPLKVGAVAPDSSQRAAAQKVKTRYAETSREFTGVYQELERLAGITATQPATLPGAADPAQFIAQAPAISSRIQKLYAAVAGRVRTTSDPAQQQALIQRFIQIRGLVEGELPVQVAMQTQAGGTPPELERLQQEQQAFFATVATSPEKRDLDTTYTTARRVGGLFLELRTLHDDYRRLTQKDSSVAVDSELSLILWDDYPLAGKVPNVLNPRLAADPYGTNRATPIMVARLDGPTPQIVERMITEAVETERKGLAGTFYIDARGIKDKTGYYEYDEDLRTLADLVQRKTKMPVVLDNRPEVFKPGTCPGTALYCGWYSLRNYVPAFSFVPGAVGFHIASFEATTLKNRRSKEWVIGLLESGIAATLGPVDEPLLDAFPLPSEFFGLLLTGKYTLAEVFYRTSRYNSWRILLVGDPLYRPFAKTPLLDEKDIVLKPLNLLLVH